MMSVISSGDIICCKQTLSSYTLKSLLLLKSSCDFDQTPRQLTSRLGERTCKTQAYITLCRIYYHRMCWCGWWSWCSVDLDQNLNTSQKH